MFIQDLVQDLRHGVRILLKRRVFTLVVILTLALGIGANTAVFSVFNGVILKPFTWKDPDRIVYIRRSLARGARYERGTDSIFRAANANDFYQWRENSQSFESMSALRGNTIILTGTDQSERLWSRRVAERFFETLGVSAQLGRTFTDQDYAADAPRTVILANEFWRGRFGADPQILGRNISLDGQPHTVIGVMPPEFFPAGAAKPQVWIPHSFTPAEKADHGAGRWAVVGRLRPGVSFEQAQNEMDLIAARLETTDPEGYQNKGIVLIPAVGEIIGSLGRVFLLLLAAVGLLLLVACVNVANLLLVHASEREREFGVRAVVGARFGRLFRQLLTESMLLAVAGGVLGLLLGLIGMRLIKAGLPDAANIPRLDELKFDWRVFAFAAGVSLLTGILFGLVPALRTARPNVQQTLKEAGRGNASSRRKRRMGELLMIGEIALSMILLVAAGLLVQSFVRLQRTDPGFKTNNLLTMGVHVPDYKYGNYKRDAMQMASRISLFHQVEEHINQLPGLESAAVAGRLPVRDIVNPVSISIEGRTAPSGTQNDCAELNTKTGLFCHGAVGINSVTPGYFPTLGLQATRGRLFDDHDTADAPAVAVISETTAHTYWPNEDPLGKRFLLNYGSSFPKLEIVGVVPDIRTDELDKPPRPEIYRPMAQLPSDDGQLIIRAKGGSTIPLSAVREEINRIDRDVPLVNVQTMDRVIGDTLWRSRLSAWLLGIFAMLAAAITAAGLYSVISYSISQRTQELGLRMALGANPGSILRMVIVEGFRLVAIGLVIGLAAAFALSRFIASQLFGVTATDPLTYTGVGLLLAVVTLIACYVPAYRAAKTDPMISLRYE